MGEDEELVARLHVLLHLDVTDHDIDGFLSFMMSITDTFVTRLKQKDEKAILILGYWCALFGRLDQWWITSSAKIECTRICAYLAGSPDARTQALLKFPASLCGYTFQRNDLNHAEDH